MPTDIAALSSSLPESLIQTVGPLGLNPRADLPTRGIQDLIGKLVTIVRHTAGQHQTTLLWLGDALAAQSKLDRGQLAKIAEAAEVSRGALRNVKMVCTRIKLSWRRDKLSWSHHMEVGLATEDEEQIKEWLDLAIRENLSVRKLREHIRTRLSQKSSRKISGDKSAASFGVLRELNASARSLKRHRATWLKWTPEEWHQARTDLGPLLEFVTHLQRKLPASSRPRG